MVEQSDLTPSVPSWLHQIYEPMRRAGERVAEFFSPNSEAAATEDFYEVKVELPGVSDKDIKVEMHDGRLTITGEKRSETQKEGKNYFFSERTYGKFQRAFRLPADADENKVSATHKDGVLAIQIAKHAATKEAAKSIPINRG